MLTVSIPFKASTPEKHMGSATHKDDLATICSIAVVAYICETLGHELLGHGLVCKALGGDITALAPLWMRCSIQSKLMVAAGPCLNFLVAGAGFLLVRRRTGFTALNYFLWLLCAFNLLVACGYLMVGGATGFGDWGVLFNAINPAWLWRAPAVLVGLAGYLLGLRVLGGLYGNLTWRHDLGNAVLWRRTLLPGLAAGLVACLAEVASGARAPGGLVLPIGCTVFVGWSLMSISKSGRPPSDSDLSQTVPLTPGWIGTGLVLALLFVLVIGRGASLA